MKRFGTIPLPKNSEVLLCPFGARAFPQRKSMKNRAVELKYVEAGIFLPVLYEAHLGALVALSV